MPFIAINLSSPYDFDNLTRFETLDEAQGRAKQGLEQSPNQRWVTAELIEEYTAEVVITGSQPTTQAATAGDAPTA